MFGSYLSVLRRRFAAILLTTVLLAPVVFLFLTAGANTYSSMAVVQIGSGAANVALDTSQPYEEPERRLATELEFFDSQLVETSAREKLLAQGWTGDLSAIGENVEASPRGVSSLIEIVGTDGDAERARQLTEAFVESYIQYRQQYQQDALAAVASSLEAELDTAEADLAAFDGQPASDDIAVERARAAAIARYERITGLYENVRLRQSVDTSGVALLSPATDPVDPAPPLGVVPAAILATLAAGLLGCGVALLIDLARNPVRTRAEAQSLVAAATLSTLPRPRGNSSGWGPSLENPAHPTSAAARGLRLRLDGAANGTPPRAVLVTATPKDAADCLLVGTALAVASGQAGRRTVLVADASGGGASVLPVADGEVSAGPRSAVRGAAAVTASTFDNVWLAPAMTGSGGGLLDAPSPADALADLRHAFEVVVVVEPPSEALEAATMSHLFDARLVVCALGRTRGRSLEELDRRLRQYGDSLEGLVLVRAGRRGHVVPAGVRDQQESTPAENASARHGQARHGASPATTRYASQEPTSRR